MNRIFKKVLITCIIMVPVFCLGNYVPGVVLARIKPGIIEIPQNQLDGTVELIKGNIFLKNFLTTAGLSKIRKVFPEFQAKDTVQ